MVFLYWYALFSIFFCQFMTFELEVKKIFERKGTCGNSCHVFSRASPSYVVDENGRSLIIGAHNSVYALNATSGDVLWTDPNPLSSRTWPGVVTFLDTGGNLVIVTGHDNGYVCSRDSSGNQNFCIQPDSSTHEIRGISAGKIFSGDNNYYILVAIGVARRENLTYVLDLSGKTILRRPRSESLDGRCTYPGNYGVATRDINGDGNLEIFLQCDNCHYLVIKSDGEKYPCKYIPLRNESYWSEVCWSRKDEEIIKHPYNEDYHPNFHRSPITTFEFRGKLLIAVTGYMLFHSGAYEDGTMGMFIVKPNKERYVNTTLGVDWSTGYMFDQPVHIDTGTMNTAMPNLAVYDITGDGLPEFIFSGMDGYVHCISFDKTEKNNWPIRIRTDSEWRGSSEVAIFAIPGYGSIIVFSSWGVKASSVYGYVHFVDSSGDDIIPKFRISEDSSVQYNGANQAPTLFFNDEIQNSNLFVAFQSIYDETILFEISNSTNAEILWSTARGNFLRAGYTSATYQVDVKSGVDHSADQMNNTQKKATSEVLVFFFLFFVFFVII